MKTKPLLILVLISLLIIGGCDRSKPTPKPSIIKPLTDNEISVATCEEISHWRDTVGVYDTDVAHPGYAGWTIAYFKYSSFVYDLQRKQSQTFNCFCNGKTYDDINVCLSECKVTLGCFTGICAPSGDQVCLTAIKITVEFSVTTDTFGLTWKPAQSLSQACRNEISAWQTRIETHEQRHIQDANDIVRAINNTWKQKTVEACGSSESAARQALESGIKAELDKSITDMETDLANRGNSFHQTSEGNPINDPDCSKCP